MGGHCLALGMHLLHKLRSHRRFAELFTTRYSTIKAIKCTDVFHERLKVHTAMHRLVARVGLDCLLQKK